MHGKWEVISSFQLQAVMWAVAGMLRKASTILECRHNHTRPRSMSWGLLQLSTVLVSVFVSYVQLRMISNHCSLCNPHCFIFWCSAKNLISVITAAVSELIKKYFQTRWQYRGLSDCNHVTTILAYYRECRKLLTIFSSCIGDIGSVFASHSPRLIAAQTFLLRSFRITR